MVGTYAVIKHIIKLVCSFNHFIEQPHHIPGLQMMYDLFMRTFPISKINIFSHLLNALYSRMDACNLYCTSQIPV